MNTLSIVILDIKCFINGIPQWQWFFDLPKKSWHLIYMQFCKNHCMRLKNWLQTQLIHFSSVILQLYCEKLKTIRKHLASMSNIWNKFNLKPMPFSKVTVPYLHPCLWPDVCGQPLFCHAPHSQCVCFQGCQTFWAFWREEWHLRTLASSRVGGPLQGGSWMSIWEPEDRNLQCYCNSFGYS